MVGEMEMKMLDLKMKCRVLNQDGLFNAMTYDDDQSDS